MKERQAFLTFHQDMKHIKRDLTYTQMGELWALLDDYSESGERVDVEDIAVRIYYNMLADKIDAQAEHYEEVGSQRAEAGRKGAEKRWGKRDVKPTDETAVGDDGTATSANSKNSKAKNDIAKMANAIPANSKNGKNAYSYEDSYSEAEAEAYSYEDEDSEAAIGGSGSSSSDSKAADDERIAQAYVDATGKPPTRTQVSVLSKLKDEYGTSMLIEGIEEMGRAGKTDLRYLTGILSNWRKNGKREHRPPDKAGNPYFTDFKQREDDIPDDIYNNFGEGW